ncbi:hypothetical protein Tco_1104021 [Tanacetum coccineum]
MGELTFFLGLQVKQQPDGIFISQDKYVQDMLRRFDMESVRPATTPYEAAKPKSKDEPDDAVNVHLYRSMIGSLMYLTASRPDIMFAVSACSRHQVTPLTSNLNAVKKIFKYLKGQPKLGLWKIHMVDDNFMGRKIDINGSAKSETSSGNFPIKQICCCWLTVVVRFTPLEGKLTFHKNKFSPQWRFLQMILDIETRNTKPYHAFRLTSKMFANMRLNFHGDHMPLVAAMLPPPQAAIAAGTSGEAAPPNPQTDHETVTEPVHQTVSPHDHGSTSPRPTPTTPAAQLNKGSF